MKRPNITPGPWSLALYNYRARVTTSGLPVADLQGCHDQPYEANAKAIAAVPDLLAALEYALGCPGGHLNKVVREALTKAGYEFP